MAFAEFTKQIAVQAIGDALDSKPAKPATPESTSSTMLGQRIRVFEFFVPSQQVIVMSGVDNAKNTARVVSGVDALQLVCKVVKVPPPAKANRINFVAPKSKE